MRFQAFTSNRVRDLRGRLKFVYLNSLIIAMCLLSCAISQGKASPANNIKLAADQDPIASAASTTGDAQPLQELSLNDIQDAGVLLNHIKRQAINLYEEASRTPVRLDASPDIPEINTIPTTTHPGILLPPRREWLMFYLGTMEPVIRQLDQHVKDIQSGVKRVVIPEPLRASLDPLWDAWAKDIEKLNHHLDELVPLFEDAPNNNLAIQKTAVAVFDDIQETEKLRRQIFLTVQKSKKSGDHIEKIFISPP
jgi:hypothetical protein